MVMYKLVYFLAKTRPTHAKILQTQGTHPSIVAKVTLAQK